MMVGNRSGKGYGKLEEISGINGMEWPLLRY
jgi:hypothetical protein